MNSDASTTTSTNNKYLKVHPIKMDNLKTYNHKKTEQPNPYFSSLQSKIECIEK